MRPTTTTVALAIAAALISAPTASACQGAGGPAGSESPSVVRDAVRCLINHKREANGLRLVRGNAALAAAASGHSVTMDRQNFFAHDGSDGSPGSRAAAAGYTRGWAAWGIGEVLGFGTGQAGSPRSIVADWMHSPEHRYILLLADWRQVGIGVSEGSPFGADGAGMATYAVDFGYHRR